MFSFIRSMRWFIKKNWYRYFLVLFFGLILTVLNLLPATVIGKLTDAVENSDETPLTKAFLINDILLPYLVIVFSIYIIAICKRMSQNRLTTTLYYALQVRYMDKILAQDATFFEKYQSGDLLSRALGDVATVKFSGGNRLLNIFIEATTVVATFIALILIKPTLALFCFLPLTLIFVLNLKLKAKVKQNWKVVREENAKMSNVILESITNVRTIRAYSKEEENYHKNLVYSDSAYKVEKANLKINVIFQPLFQGIVAISTIICYGLGAYYYSIDKITLSSLVKFVLYLNLFQSPLTNIGNMINNFYQSLISADRLNEVYDSESLVIDLNDAKVCKHIKKIEFKNFTFHYSGDEFDSLEGINLVINEGETIGIVGKTGCGKSTLVKQLVRQTSIDNNSIFINNKPIEAYEKESVRKLIAYVPQEHVLFSRSVLDNVALGKDNPTKEEIDKAIELADFKKDIKYLPKGLDTIVGEYGVTLSGGQKQRLAIARAFLRNADVLILDDSLSAVDGTTEANIINSLSQNRKNKTNIIVAHRLSAVMQADKIIVLDNGKIVESGNHKELMSKDGWYKKQFIAQQMTDKEEK